MDSVETYRNDDGSLTAYAWPGGYPLYYLTTNDNTLCAACANKDAGVRGAGIHYEGEPITCDECNTQIESAYGPLEECDS